MKITKKNLENIIKEELLAVIKEAEHQRIGPPAKMHQSIGWSEDPADPQNIIAIVSRLSIKEKELRERFDDVNRRLSELESLILEYPEEEADSEEAQVGTRKRR